MLEAVARRLHGATTLPQLAQAVVEELAPCAGVRSSALVLCDGRGEPRLWIGDATADRAAIRAYLDGGFRTDAAFARVCQTYVPEVAGTTWIGPLFGAERIVGALRVEIAHGVDSSALAMVAAYVSIRLAHTGLASDEAPALDTLTARQREVAELIVRGCTNPEIARMLAISPNAVKKHVSRVLATLEVSNRTELAALTGRWQLASGSHQILPPTLQLVVRNPAGSLASPRTDERA